MRKTRTSYIAVLLVFAAVRTASADLDITFDDGGLSPYRGGSISQEAEEWRHQLSRLLLGEMFSERVHLGAEVEVARYPTAVMGLPEFQLKSYQVRATLQFVPFPHTVSPYAGIGVGIDATRFEDDAIESTYGSRRVASFGLGIGGIGFVGVQVPLGEDMALFGEARARLGTQLASDVDLQASSDRMTGLGGVAGLRMSF